MYIQCTPAKSFQKFADTKYLGNVTHEYNGSRQDKWSSETELSFLSCLENNTCASSLRFSEDSQAHQLSSACQVGGGGGTNLLLH